MFAVLLQILLKYLPESAKVIGSRNSFIDDSFAKEALMQAMNKEIQLIEKNLSSPKEKLQIQNLRQLAEIQSFTDEIAAKLEMFEDLQK